MSARSVNRLAVPDLLTMPHNFLADQVRGRNNLDALDHLLMRRKRIHDPHIHEMTVLRLPNLVQAVANPIRHDSNADRDLETLREITAQFLGQLGGSRREDIDVLGHSRFIDIGIHRVGAKSTASVRPRRNSSTASWIVASGKGSRMMNSRNVSDPSPNIDHLPRCQTTDPTRVRQSAANSLMHLDAANSLPLDVDSAGPGRDHHPSKLN